tara:strand:- start:28521 stop:29078 length:558 start_codon:yes stop_codon:yes gene_type:complete
MFIKYMWPILLSFLFTAQVQAHGGLSLADDMCKLTVGPYTMHFTGYQPNSSKEKEFCEDIPATGRTVVALDYIEEALRPLPTEVRVIKDTGSEENLDSITILHLPAKVYSNGSINFEHTFNEPGKFVGLVTSGKNQEHVSRFPFSVGEGSSSMPPGLVFAIAAALGLGAFFLFKVGKKSQDKSAT